MINKDVEAIKKEFINEISKCYRFNNNINKSFAEILYISIIKNNIKKFINNERNKQNN